MFKKTKELSTKDLTDVLEIFAFPPSVSSLVAQHAVRQLRQRGYCSRAYERSVAAHIALVSYVVCVADDSGEERIRDVAKLIVANRPRDAFAVEYVGRALAISMGEYRSALRAEATTDGLPHLSRICRSPVPGALAPATLFR